MNPIIYEKRCICNAIFLRKKQIFLTENCQFHEILCLFYKKSSFHVVKDDACSVRESAILECIFPFAADSDGKDSSYGGICYE